MIDCHVHVIDPARFPYAEGPGYKPHAHEVGTREELAATLAAHGVQNALLVQPSCYGTDHAALLDALRVGGGRLKGVGVVDATIPDRALDGLAAAGVVGVRFNLSYHLDALMRAGTERFLERLLARRWFAEVNADDGQWPEAADVLCRSGVAVLIDHFGISDVRPGADRAGFRAILALGRAGSAVVKLSAPFRHKQLGPGYCALAPFVEELVDAFGIERCVWGSDWPFINAPDGLRYADMLGALESWLPDEADRERVLWENPRRLFRFTD